MSTTNRFRSAVAMLVLAAAVMFMLIASTNTVYAASKPSKMTVKATSTTVDIKGKVRVYVKSVSPKKASKAVTFKSSNKKIATVSSKGIVTGKKKGTVKITVTSKKNKKLKKTVKITVKDLKSTSISISETELNMPVGTESKLSAKVKGKTGYYNQGVVWASDNPEAVTVSATGEITAVGGGVAVVTATEKNGTRAATCTVNALAELQPGDSNITFGDFKWSVLDVQDGKAMLLTDIAVENHSYNDVYGKVTWATCDLRNYLNGEFMDAHFSEKNRSLIAETNVETPDNAWFGTSGGDACVDKVFLLSMEEVVKYFGDSGKLSAGRPNDPVNTDNNQVISDEYDEARIVRNSDNADVWWWLRSPGFNESTAGIISRWGYLYVMGYFVDKAYGIRPAVWIDIAG